eukprot:Pgem_evm1s10677
MATVYYYNIYHSLDHEVPLLNYCSAIGFTFVEISFASMVLLVRQINRLLRLKSKKNEYIYLCISGVHFIVNVVVTIFQTSKEEKDYLLFHTHIVNFIFMCFNCVVYTSMFLRFRRHVMTTREASLQVTIQTSNLCRNFGWFIALYFFNTL